LEQVSYNLGFNSETIKLIYVKTFSNVIWLYFEKSFYQLIGVGYLS